MAIDGFRHSLFCALRLPTNLARDLWEQFDWLQPGDDRVEPKRLHLTLVPIGAWPHHPESVIAGVRNVCACLDEAPFRVVFDALIVGDRVLLKPSEAIPALDRFQRQLTSALADARLVSPRPRRFSPHVTVSYRSRTHERPFMVPVSWVVRDFVLIESLVGRRTQIERGRWRLQSRR